MTVFDIIATCNRRFKVYKKGRLGSDKKRGFAFFKDGGLSLDLREGEGMLCRPKAMIYAPSLVDLAFDG